VADGNLFSFLISATAIGICSYPEFGFLDLSGGIPKIARILHDTCITPSGYVVQRHFHPLTQTKKGQHRIEDTALLVEY